MNPRERILAMILLAVIFLGGGGFFGYLLYYRNLNAANVRLDKLRQDIKTNDDKLNDLEKSLPRLQQLRKMSLPADIDLARREYEAELTRLFRQAEFTTGDYSVFPKPVENRSAVPISKRMPYTRLVFDIKSEGELQNVVAFLDGFYRMPLLHRIKSISIIRPITVDRRQAERQNYLEFSASIEALVLDGAENRKTLYPVGVKGLQDIRLAERLKRTKEQYVSIAGRNVFFGPPPPAPVVSAEPRERKSEVDVTEHIILDEITHDAERGTQAALYDAFNNYKYAIKRLNDGSFLVSTYYYIKDTKKRLDIGEELNIHGDTGETQVSFKIIRIDATDLILKDAETGKFYRLHIGHTVRDGKALSKEELKAMGLATPEPEKKEAPMEGDKKPAATDAKPKSGATVPPPKPAPDEGK